MLLLLLVVWRVCNAVVTHGYFQADEFWQALEPAHFKAFGYGALTWEWRVGLRSYAFPAVFEVVYRVVKCIAPLFCPSRALWCEYMGVLYAPKVIMAVIAVLGDYYTVKTVEVVYRHVGEKRSGDERIVRVVAGVLTASNFFNCFFSTRSFVNSFEMTLTAVSLYLWDWSAIDVLSRRQSLAMCIAMFACLQRPSNALIWVVLGTVQVANLLRRRQFHQVSMLSWRVMQCFAVALAVNCAIDYHFYGELTFPIFKFIAFNLTTPLSRFYGVAPWHFHICQSVPILLGYSIPLFVFEMTRPRSSYRAEQQTLISAMTAIKLVIGFNLLMYSLLDHKEFRFIYPLQPLFTLLSTFGFIRLRKYIPRVLIYILPVLSIAASFTIDHYHESGSLRVMEFLHDEPEIDSLGFVMPCHSTPWQSFLHRKSIDDGAWAITCEPPLHLLHDTDALTKLDDYMDESDRLYNNVAEFMRTEFPAVADVNVGAQGHTHRWPQYLVVFEHLDDSFMRKYLAGSRYVEHKRFFNSLSHWDSRRAGDIIVYKFT
ncbi:putative glycosylphosphatidylinositol-alpha 1,2 mannosyltransferase KNAG_0I00730 [Huiozyma naganishii CBS 8797]|uniref:Mannosyltransferase n=1 Tax=Huiozyma naganishii (strain ATCC MYA-139 / BCRC 22969 / CBS 8797 / KCTC 17520 / NBRC 10181 / NCYC 3082 / Yp74L-3) TaxID=1071383 RepID=J7S919_HUIN7|nr:hypothetical protein KNAG_0I00730 [Kazachstania naganishii CBS 8797]CCK71864.1 hypothetical protein KNAG_0I00730 [Kazachstania naganishii CBS 8797]